MRIVTTLLIGALQVAGLVKWSVGQSPTCYDGSGNPYTLGQQIQQDCNTCTCQEDGWSCTQRACSDPCFSSPCENDGECVRDQDSYICLCKSGYFGSNCESDAESCSDGDVVANGYCDEDCYCLNGTVTCDPPTGCPDLECNTTALVLGDCCPTCWPDPKAGFCPGSNFTSIGSCENTCRHDVNCTGDQKCCFNGCGLSCMDPRPVPSGVCELSPCKNGGTCLDIMSVIAVCQCLPGFRGNFCEVPDGKPCLDDGTWYRDTQRFDLYCLTCVCNDGNIECTDECGEKPGECPITDEENMIIDCLVDQDCPGQEKCCNQSCTLPNLAGLACTYQGMILQSGDSYHEQCNSCTCSAGVLECNRLCPVEKEGTCPVPSVEALHLNCVANCRDDRDCNGVEKCCGNGCDDECVKPLEANSSSDCFFRDEWYSDSEKEFMLDCQRCQCLNGTIVCRGPICPQVSCPNPVMPESECCPLCLDDSKPGECPAIESNSPPGNCSSPCSDDASCPDDQKCCQDDDCGLTCKAPTEGRPGMCPFLLFPSSTACVHECQIDDHCDEGQKCCLNTCNAKVCLDPIPEDSVVCGDQPCLNGGECIHVNGSFYQCKCLSGFYGGHCENIVLNCSNVICQNGGECVEPSWGSPSSSSSSSNLIIDPWECECATGFSGDLCEDQDELCDTNRCENGGTCYKATASVTTCACVDGYTGSSCEELEVCLSQPCLNGGTCRSYYYFSGQFYICNCQESFSGDNCEIENSPCNKTCLNGGICSLDVCSCSGGYTGENCENPPLNCSNVICQNGGECVEPSWGPSSSSSSSNLFVDPWYCDCATGFRGDLCEVQDELCDTNRCENGGTCYKVTASVTTCACVDGYTGSSCEQLEVCHSQPCLNGGTCSSYYYFSNFYYDCNCQERFSGDNCEIESHQDCSTVICQNDGTCIEDESSTGWQCICTLEFRGEFCEEYEPCFGQPCENGGSCQLTISDEIKCACPAGTSGNRCENSVTDACVFSPCLNGGSCSEFKGLPDCSCTDSFTGRFCDIPVNDACQNGTQPVSCLFDPCHVASCPAYPNARCKSNYCGGCNAEFYDDIGSRVDCRECDYAEKVRCVINPCDVTTCSESPRAYCDVSYCGSSCEPVFLINDDELASCDSCSDPQPCPVDPCDACETIPDGAECRVDKCKSCAAEIYDVQGNRLSVCPDTSKECLPGLPYVPCLHDPCLDIVCPGYPDAVCRPDYCGGCTPEFVDPVSGDGLECNACPNNEPLYRCASDPCSSATCSAYPGALCRVNQCGSCSAEFISDTGEVLECTDYCKDNNCRYGSNCIPFDGGYYCECPAFKRGEFCEEDFCEFEGDEYEVGEKMDSDCNTCECGKSGTWICSEKQCDLTCVDRDQTYYAGDQRDDEDACNTCICNEQGGWDCTENVCDGTVVEIEFSFDLNFADIENELEEFKQSLRLDLSTEFSIPVTSLKDFQLSSGSVMVKFKLVSGEELSDDDISDVADNVQTQLESGDYIFTLEGQDITVIPGSVVVSEPIIAQARTPVDETNVELIVGVSVAATAFVMIVVVIVLVMHKKRKASKQTYDLSTVSKQAFTFNNTNFESEITKS